MSTEELARQAGAIFDDGELWLEEKHWIMKSAQLERFAALVRADERAKTLEEAAKVCDRYAAGGVGGWKHNTPYECAEALRALK